MSENEQSNTLKKPTRRYRFVGLGVIGLVLILGWTQWNQILNEDERKVIGRWTNEFHFEDGNRLNTTLSFLDDRTMKLHDTFVLAETEDEEIRPRVTMVEATWQIKNGQIVITPDRSSRTRLRLSLLKLAHAVSGRKFIDGELGEGRISFPEPDEMVIQWYDPFTKKYQNGNNRMRRDWTREI